MAKREPLINIMMTETQAFESTEQGGLRRQWRKPLSSSPTQLCTLKAVSRKGLAVLACSLRCSFRRIAMACDLQTAPRDSRQYDSNSAHHGINQRFLSKGFTLIEVMVALLIVAIALSAMLVRIQGFIGSTIYLQEKTLASWVALNQLELVKLTNQATHQLLEGEVSGDADMANRQWLWTINPIETEAEGYQQLQVSVALAEFPEDSLVTITGIIDSHY